MKWINPAEEKPELINGSCSRNCLVKITWQGGSENIQHGYYTHSGFVCFDESYNEYHGDITGWMYEPDLVCGYGGEAETYYKIVNDDGKYSTGGAWPSFTRDGKRWRTMAHVNAHLTQLHRNRFEVYKDCHLISVALVTTSRKVTPMHSLMESQMEKAQLERKKRAEENKKAMDVAAKQERKRLYEELRREFDHE